MILVTYNPLTKLRFFNPKFDKLTSMKNVYFRFQIVHQTDHSFQKKNNLGYEILTTKTIPAYQKSPQRAR